MHDVVRELFQALRARAEGAQGGFCVDQHVLGELAGVGEKVLGMAPPVAELARKVEEYA